MVQQRITANKRFSGVRSVVLWCVSRGMVLVRADACYVLPVGLTYTVDAYVRVASLRACCSEVTVSVLGPLVILHVHVVATSSCRLLWLCFAGVLGLHVWRRDDDHRCVRLSHEGWFSTEQVPASNRCCMMWSIGAQSCSFHHWSAHMIIMQGMQQAQCACFR
jgi:hypothetical protein